MIDQDQELRSLLREVPFDDRIQVEHRDRLEKQLLAKLAEQRSPAESPKRAFWPCWPIDFLPRWAGYAAATACLILLATVLISLSNRAYAIGDTVAALQRVRFLRVVMLPNTNGLVDERWIEIGLDGTQIRYRQQTLGMGSHLLIVDDGEKSLYCDQKKNTATITSGKDRTQYQWIGNLQAFFQEMADDRNVVPKQESNSDGRKQYRLWWPKLNVNCYVDAGTRLPTQVGPYRITYEPPPVGAFDCTVPAGMVVVNQTEAPEGPNPPTESQPDMDINTLFRQAREQLTLGQWEGARVKLERVVQAEPKMNWAWFWLGHAYERTGEVSAAITAYTRVIDMLSALGFPPHYCYLARGMVYRRTGEWELARKDLAIALPVMIASLERVDGTTLFEYADNPLWQFLAEHQKPSEAQRFERMIQRLQAATGIEFPPQGTKAASAPSEIATAWKNWWAQHAAEYQARESEK